MIGFMFSGLALVLCVLSMLARTNLKRWLGYTNFVDVAFTLIILFMFHGTFSGVVAGAMAGIWMSVLLQIIRKGMGCERVSVKWVGGRIKHPVLYWRYYAPSELSWYSFKKEAVA